MHCDWQGKFAGCPKTFGSSLSPCCRSIRDARKLGDPADLPRPSPVVFFICSHQLPVEGTPPTIWQPQYGSSLFPRVDTPGYLAAILEAGGPEVRSETRYRLAMAVGGRRTTKSPLGGKKKREKSHRSR